MSDQEHQENEENMAPEGEMNVDDDNNDSDPEITDGMPDGVFATKDEEGNIVLVNEEGETVPGGEELREIGEIDENGDVVDDSSARFDDHTDAVYCVALSPDGETALSGGGDDLAFLWNAKDGKTVFKFEGHTDSVVAVQFSAAGEFVATGGLDGNVKVWKCEDGSLVCNLEAGSGVEWMEWHNQGNVIICGTEDGMLWMWTVPSGKLLQCLAGHGDSSGCGGFTPDGKLIVSGSMDCTARVWNPQSGQPNHIFQGQNFHTEGIVSMACHPRDTKLMVTGSLDHSSILCNIENGKIVGKLQGHTDSVETVAFCQSEQNLVATGGVDGKVIVWDLNSLTQRCAVAHEDAITKVLWHPAAPLMLSASADSTVRVWDGRTGECVKRVRGQMDPILDMALSKNALSCATASDDMSVCVFNLFE